MKILAIGDLVGDTGVKKLEQCYNKIVEENNIDFTVVNAENSADGRGITVNIFKRLQKLGIDAITMGNHTWGRKEIFQVIDEPIMLRPANYSKGVVGKGFNIYKKNGKSILVVNLIGRTDMAGVQSDNPFTCFEDILKTNRADIYIVDFHAEATAEKIAFKYNFDGKAQVIFGTHTHIQTADEEITPNGTAYITDIGMTGPINSVLGMDVDVAIKRFLTSIPEKYVLAKGPCKLNGIVVTIDDNTNKAIEIKRIKL